MTIAASPDELSEIHSQALQSLKVALASVLEDPEVQKYVASLGGLDRCLLRWLRTSKFDVSAAQQRFEDTLKWREEVKANSVLEDPQSLELADRFKSLWPAAYCHPTKDGLSVVYARVGQLNPNRIMSEFTEAELITYFVYWLETSSAIQRQILEKRQAQGLPLESCRGQIEIYDCTGLSLWQIHIQGIKLLARIAGLWCTHYPDNMLRGFIINTPAIFNLAWKVIQPALSEDTRSRISVSYGNAEKELLEFMDTDELRAVFASVPTCNRSQ